MYFNTLQYSERTYNCLDINMNEQNVLSVESGIRYGRKYVPGSE